MKHTKNQVLNGLLVVLAITLNLISVSAFSVGSSYSDSFPLEVYPGESKEVVLSLQSDLTEGDLSVKAIIEKGSEIASIADSSEEYKVIGGSTGTIVKIKVEVPATVAVGETYDVSLLFRDITPREGGTVGLATGVGRTFKVLVAEKPVEKPAQEEIGIGWIILGVVVVIAVIAVIWFIVKKRRQ